MVNILIVEGNNLEIIERNTKANIKIASTCYQESLAINMSQANFEVAMPFAPQLETAKRNPNDYDAIALTGSGIPYKPHEQGAMPYMDYLERVLQSGKPILGSCWGMQAVAVALGGKCETNPKGTEAGIAKDIELTQEGRLHPAFKGIKNTFASPCIHRDHVTQLPKGAIRLAGNTVSENQSMSYNLEGIDYFGVQFHPELEVGYINKLLKLRGVQATSNDVIIEQPEPDDKSIFDTLERTKILGNWLHYALKTKMAA